MGYHLARRWCVFYIFPFIISVGEPVFEGSKQRDRGRAQESILLLYVVIYLGYPARFCAAHKLAIWSWSSCIRGAHFWQWDGLGYDMVMERSENRYGVQK